MNQIIVLSLVTFGLLLSGVATLNAFLVSLSLPFFLYLLSGLFYARDQLNLAVTRQLSTERTTPGEKITFSVKVTNRGSKIDAVLVEDKLSPNIEVVDNFPRQLINLKPNESFIWSYQIIGQRGFYSFHEIHVETRSILGLNPVRRTYSTTGSLLILPKISNIQRIPIRPYWTRVYAGEIPARSGGQGTDFYGIRQYQPTDPPNRINWHASARHPTMLFSNEYEENKASDVGIILDGREKVNKISSTVSIYEYSIQAAATLAATFIKQGDRVSLLKYGKYLDWIFPGYGKYQLERILRALSTAQPGQSLVFSYLEYIPTQIFPPKSQIVLISPLAQDDPDVLLKIRAHGYQVLVISPDPISFEQSNLPDTETIDTAVRILQLERKLQITRLLQGGVQVLNWNVQHPLEQVINHIQRSPFMSQSAGLSL